MKETKILILGGYGTTGRMIASLLLKESSAEVIIAGRNLEKASTFSQELGGQFGDGRVSYRFADASLPESLLQAFQDINCVVVASSTVQYTHQVAETAIRARVDYLDIQYSREKLTVLESLSSEIESSGLLFITDGGFHPGLPGAMVRYASSYFDEMNSARIGSVIKIDWSQLDLSAATKLEFVAEFKDYRSLIYQDSTWKKISTWKMFKPPRMDFGGEFKQQIIMPMYLDEMGLIPELLPSIGDAGFYVGSFNWFTDWIVFPLAAVLLTIAPKSSLKFLSDFLFWSLVRFSKPPYKTMLKLEASGNAAGEKKAIDVLIEHEDGYWLTAVSVAACLLQYLDHELQAKGLVFQALVVEPQRFMEDMERMGIGVSLTERGEM